MKSEAQIREQRDYFRDTPYMKLHPLTRAGYSEKLIEFYLDVLNWVLDEDEGVVEVKKK